VGDNPYDISDVPYGNGNPQNLDFRRKVTAPMWLELSGQLKETMDLGMDGAAAQNVKIMALKSSA
jgi:hypothetical protein